ncbi:MAG: hypothetical protein M1840_005271 [Geoglossum simile]|nr:MAG: hypothetical protein M1840_005271 [Geoglossum simile]
MQRFGLKSDAAYLKELRSFIIPYLDARNGSLKRKLENLTEELEAVHTVHQLCCSGEFYDDYRKRKLWDKVTECLRTPWRLDTFGARRIYLDWVNEYKYGYQEDATEDGESDESVSYGKIGLILAATFGDPLLNTLVKRNHASWRPAFHRVDSYWEQLSRSSMLRGRSWESVKARTISLLKEIENLSSNNVPFLHKYEATPLRDFTHKQNMFLVARALKLGVLTPFPLLTSWDDLAEMLSKSETFPYHIGLEELMLNTVRVLQESMIKFDPSEEEFWEALRDKKAKELSLSIPKFPDLPTLDIPELEGNYKGAMRLYKSPPSSIPYVIPGRISLPDDEEQADRPQVQIRPDL